MISICVTFIAYIYIHAIEVKLHLLHITAATVKPKIVDTYLNTDSSVAWDYPISFIVWRIWDCSLFLQL